jgi:hypothetical protein
MNKSIYSKLIILALFYLLFNHLAACFLYFAAKNAIDSEDPDTMGNVMNKIIIDSHKPFLNEVKKKNTNQNYSKIFFS